MQTLLTAGALAPFGAGCGPSAQEQRSAQARQDFREAFTPPQAIAEPAQPVAHPKRLIVAQGRSPVVFDVRTPALAHVMDLTAGTEIVAVNVASDQFVSVNEQSGVRVGTHRIVPGPLPAGHEFGILLDVGGEESFDSLRHTEPVPPPMSPRVPATRPVAVPAPSVGSQLKE